ncbi:hypothetical protein SGRI78S_01678 [Streptomyces griseus subsp. griseus]
MTSPPSSTNTGTVSRAHMSSTASGMTSTCEPQARWAAFRWSGLAIMTTYSYSATARAIRAMSSRTYGRSSSHTDSRAGHDMNVRAWLSHSAPRRRSPSDARSEPVPTVPDAASSGPQAVAPKASAPSPARV